MLKRALGIAVLSLVPTLAFAQTATPNSRLAAEQAALDLAQANSITWHLIIDTAPGVLLTKTCVAPPTPTGFTCTTGTLPAMTPGAHVLGVTSTLDGATSAPSAGLNIVMFILQAPMGLRVVEMFGPNPLVAQWQQENLAAFLAAQIGSVS